MTYNSQPPGLSRAEGEASPPANPNAGFDTDQAQSVDIKVAGRSNIYLGSGVLEDPVENPSAEAPPIYYFGQQMDDTPIVEREFYNDVPGDSHGGPNGPPIDRQNLGKILQVTFTLSAWSQWTRDFLTRHNEVYATPGYVADYEIGTVLFHDHCFRILIEPLQDNWGPKDAVDQTDKSKDWFTYNFVNAQLSSPIETGQGTKFSSLRFTMEAHRAPPAHTKRGVIWDRDIEGLQAAKDRLSSQMAQQSAGIARP